MSDKIPALIFFVGLAVGWTVRLRHTVRNRRNVIVKQRGSRLELALVVLAVIALHVLPVVYVLTPRLTFADYELSPWANLAGAAILALGIWLFWRSHADLGRNWSPVPRIHHQQSLVTAGVYRQIRHPMYAAHWLAAIGQALLLENWLAGPLFLVLFAPIYLLRVAREEQMMIEHFGADYLQYIKRTGQVIPRWRRA